MVEQKGQEAMREQLRVTNMHKHNHRRAKQNTYRGRLSLYKSTYFECLLFRFFPLES